MSDKLGFFESLFDVDGDGKVTDQDFMDDFAMFQMINNDHKSSDFDDDDELEEEREAKREQLEDLGLDPYDYDEDELDDLDIDDIELM